MWMTAPGVGVVDTDRSTEAQKGLVVRGIPLTTSPIADIWSGGYWTLTSDLTIVVPGRLGEVRPVVTTPVPFSLPATVTE